MMNLSCCVVAEIVLETQVKNTQLEGPTPIEVTICRSTSTASLQSAASPPSPHGGRSPSPSQPPANSSQFMSPPVGAIPAKIGPFSGVVSLFEGRKKTNVSLSEEDTANFSEKAIKSAVCIYLSLEVPLSHFPFSSSAF